MNSPLGQSIFGPILLLKPSNQVQPPLKLPKSLTTPPTVWDCSAVPYEVDKKQKTDLYQNYQQKPYQANQYQNNQNIQNIKGKTLNSTYAENQNQSFKGLTNILKQVKLRCVTKDDNFYCSCNQSEENTANHVCIACHGKGNVDGSHNIVKFISFIMEFKLGSRGPYKANHNKEHQINQQLQSYQPSDLSLSDKNSQKNNKTTILQSQSMKQNAKTSQFSSDLMKDEQQQQLKNNQQKTVITANKSIQQVQTYNQTLSGINIGGNSIGQSLQNSQPYDPSNQQGTKNRTNVTNVDEIRSQGMVEKQNTLSVFEKGEHQCTDQCQENCSLQKKNKKVRFKCPIRNKQQNDDNQMQHQVPNTRSMVYEIGRKKIIDVRKSLPAPQPFMHLQQLTVKLSKQSKIHHQYICDQCKVTPIQGSRFHCTSLMCKNNYDLCEKCYLNIGHRHQMKQIKYTQVNQLCQSLQKFSNNTIRSSIKLGGGLRNSTTNYQDHSIQQQGNDNQEYKTIFKSSIH